MATFAKLKNGAWGVRVSGTPTVGASVTVTKKSGATSTARIGRILWTGADRSTGETVSLCEIASTASTPCVDDRVSCFTPPWRRGRESGYDCDHFVTRCSECDPIPS